MYGTSTFAARPLGASPLAWRRIFDALGLPTCGAQVAGQGSTESTASASFSNLVGTNGPAQAAFFSSGTLSVASSLEPLAAALWNAGSALGSSSQISGAGGAVLSTTGLVTGAGYLTGYRMRAYDQAFPANPSSGSIVQIGSRLFEWKVSLARWHPTASVP